MENPGLSNQPNRFPLIIPVGIFIVFALTVTFAAFYYYFSIRQEVATSYGNTLSSITKLKIRQIQNYHAERLSDARYLYKNAGFSQAVYNLLRNPSGEQQQRSLHTWLDQLQKNHNYKIIQVINNQKDVIFATGLREGLSHEAPVPKNHSFEGMTGPEFIDIHLNKSRQHIQIHIYVPVYYQGISTSDIIGAVIFTIDPFVFFYPMIFESPLPTKTGETILTRIEKDSIVYISPLRFYAGNPLELAVSKTDSSRTSVKVTKGLTSFGSGIDYRGKEVLFYGEIIPERNWLVITKMDSNEAYAGIQGTSVLIFSLLSSLLLISGGLLYYYTKRQNLNALQYRAESAIAVAQLNRIYELISLVNTAIARDTSQKELLKTITSISVDKAGYIFSIITLSEEEATTPVIASFSARVPVLPSKEPIIHELVAAVNLIPRSYQRPTIINNLAGGNFPEEAVSVFASNNVASFALFPLTPAGIYRGDIYFFSENNNQFSEQETTLLEELAVDLSFGLHSIAEHNKIERSEQIIKDSEIRYRNLIENSPDPILINHRNKIILVNKAAVTLFKAKEASELEGKSPLSLFSTRLRKSVAERIRYMRDTGLAVKPTEEEIICLDGSIAFVEVVAAPYKIGEELAIHIILRDITARKEQKEKLRESEERLRLSLDAANQGIFDLNIVTGNAIINEQYALMLGYNPKSFHETNASWAERLHPDDKDRCVQAYRDYIGRKTDEYRVEFRSKTADGGWKWILSMGKVIEWDQSGNPLRMLGTHTDIHKFKEAEHQLLLQSRILNQAGQIITAVSTRGRIVYWNNKAESELGWTSAEVQGKNLMEIIVPETKRPELRQTIRNASNGQTWMGNIELMRKNGSHFMSEALISPYYNSKGEPLGLIALGQDVTEKLENQQQIRNLSRAVEQSPASIIIARRDGTIIYANKKVTEVTGYSAQELIEQNLLIFSDNSPQEEARYNSIWDSLLSGSEWHGEFHTKKKNGEQIWETASISPLRNDLGEIVYLLAVKEDITVQKNLITELIHARDTAEESNRIKTNFLANMSHELRTPLIAILGFSDLLLEEENSQEKLEYLRSIYSGGERLLRTVNALLHFSNLNKSGLVLNPVEFELTELCREIIQNFRLRAERKGLIFVDECSTQLKFVTDKNLLADSLGYILDNALRFTYSGTITFATTLADDTITFTIRDTGIGIPKEKQSIIFEEFRQASEGMSRQYEGSGLGLTLANRYIQILGGSIEINSREGAGSEFKIKLPVKQNQN